MQPDSDSALANITFQKVKAHVGIEGNEQADRFANNGAMMPEIDDRDFAQAARDNERKLAARKKAPVKSVDEVEWLVELDESVLLTDEEMREMSETQNFN